MLSIDNYLEIVTFQGTGELFKVVSVTSIDRIEIEKVMWSLEQLMVVNVSVWMLNEIN